MLQAFVITLREGIEAFLIVAISLAWLRKARRDDLIPAVKWGIGVSIALSAAAGFFFARAANQALWEGILAITAAVMVASLTIHMWRAARRMRSEIEGHLARGAARAGWAGFAAVFLFTLLMITREGMETALLMSSLFFQIGSAAVLLGAVGGLAAAAVIAFLWSRYGHRVDLARFFQVTAIFLLVFVVQLLIYGFHELTEAGVLPNSEQLHWATEPYGPDGRYGQYLTWMLVLLPVGWLAWSSWRSRDSAARPTASPTTTASRTTN